MLASKLLSPIGNTDKLYVDDVFSAYTYTGNGSTQTINNGIDLAGKGGLVWTMGRQSSNVNTLIDTARGAGQIIRTHMTDPASSYPLSITSFNGNGYSLGADQNLINRSDYTGLGYVSHTFRKAPKFFDVVTYTGNGAGSRSIAHSLGVAPGMLIIKQTNSAGIWYVFHRYDETKYSMLNDTNVFSAVGSSRQFASDSFSVEGINTNGASYIAYLFAHDTTADGIVQCGSYTAGSSGASVTLGWEPQYLLVKASNVDSPWYVYDSSRGFNVTGSENIMPNTSSAAYSPDPSFKPTATGFVFDNIYYSGKTFVYLAIRRPNKPPTTGTQVFAASGYSAASTPPVFISGFPVDLSIGKGRNPGSGTTALSRLTGQTILYPSDTSAESTYSVGNFDYMNGWRTAASYPVTGSRIEWMFRRAPGFFDVVCRTGTGASTFTRVDVNHSLGVPPELIIYKCRPNAGSWIVGTFNPSNPTQGGYGQLNQTYAISSGTFPGNFLYAAPTATQFSFWDGNSFGLDTSGRTYVAYLFASLPGISKVGRYTGNGSSQTINCGFSAGARFVLIKRTDSAGDWFVWDTARGIVSANDPHLSLNTTAAEVTSNDSVDPDATGFIVNQVTATNINVTGATYLYLAIA